MKQYKSALVLAFTAFAVAGAYASTPNEPEEEVSVVQCATIDIVDAPASQQSEAEPIFTTVEQAACFPGGQGALMQWIGANLRYPEDAHENDIQGRVIVQFVIEKDGTISSPAIVRGVDKSLDKEAIRLIKKMPKWTPGRNNGQPVRSKFNLPITFRLQH